LNPSRPAALRLFSAAWLAWMLVTAVQNIIRSFPAPGAELNGDAFWTYLPNARAFLVHPWQFLTTDPASFYVAPLGFIWPALWGADPIATQLANSVLYVLSVLLMWRLATQLGGVVAGMVATALLVYVPELPVYIPQVLTEPLYMFGLLLFLSAWAEYVLAPQRRAGWLALASLGLCITLLVRPVLQLFSLAALAVLLIGLTWQVLTPSPRRWPRIIHVHVVLVLALALALALPVATVVKNGLCFNYWGLGTGAGSGIYYGVSPFKMGLEPIYSGFEYDAAELSKTVAPSTQGHPLRVRSDHIQTRTALGIVQSTTLQDNLTFFAFKLKAWALYGPEELRFLPQLRQLRWFEWLAILSAWVGLLVQRMRANQTAHARWFAQAHVPARLGLCAFLLLITLGMLVQLTPVLYNVRYNLFLVDLLLMPLAGAGIAMLARSLGARWRHPTAAGLAQVAIGVVLAALLMTAAASLTRKAVRTNNWAMDPARPGPTELVIGPSAMGPASMSDAQALGPNRWQLKSGTSTLLVPLSVDQPLKFQDGIWRVKLAITPSMASRSCGQIGVSLEHPSPETAWYVPAPVIHAQTDGQPHLYAFRGNGQLRPRASGHFRLHFQCAPGSVVHWQGAQLLKSTLPEAARELINQGTPINPYRPDDLR
jgi:hypothetical protein